MTSNLKVILLTAIESLREKKKKTKKKKRQKNKRQEGKSKRAAASEGSKPRSASLDVASVETAEAWSEHSHVKSGLAWPDSYQRRQKKGKAALSTEGLKALGKKSNDMY